MVVLFVHICHYFQWLIFRCIATIRLLMSSLKLCFKGFFFQTIQQSACQYLCSHWFRLFEVRLAFIMVLIWLCGNSGIRWSYYVPNVSSKIKAVGFVLQIICQQMLVMLVIRYSDLTHHCGNSQFDGGLRPWHTSWSFANIKLSLRAFWPRCWLVCPQS